MLWSAVLGKRGRMGATGTRYCVHTINTSLPSNPFGLLFLDQQTTWCVGVDPVSGSCDQLVGVEEQQLVIWYQGLDPVRQAVRKVYRTETAVLQAFWTHFQGCEGRSVCIREQQSLAVFMETGAVYYIPFPFLVSVPPPLPPPPPPPPLAIVVVAR